MSESGEGPESKYRRVSLGEAAEKTKEFESAQDAAFWVIEEFQKELKDSQNEDEKISKILDRLRSRISNYVSKQKKIKKALPKEEFNKPALTDSMVDVLKAEPSTSSEDADMNKGGRPTQNFDEVTERTQRRKLEPIIESLKKAGEEFGGKTPTQLCGRIVQQQNTVHNRSLGQIGKAIYDGTIHDHNKKTVSEEEALYLKNHELKISDRQYTNLRLRLLKHELSLPSLMKTKVVEKDLRYKTFEFEGGVRAHLKDLVTKTLNQACKIPEVKRIIESLDPKTSFPLKARKFTGFDGSGSQQTAMQKSRNNIAQDSRETAVAVLRDITTQDNVRIFVNEHIASTNSARPLMLIPGTENRNLVEKFLPIMDQEIKELMEKGVNIELETGQKIPCECKIELFLVDGKAVKVGTGCGGAYCLVCTYSQDEAKSIERIELGFEINRTMDDMMTVFNELCNPETGSVKKSNKDYEKRKGVTHEPLTTSNMNLSPRPLHVKLRTFPWFLIFLYRILARVLQWQDGKLTQEQKDAIKAARSRLIEAVKDATGILMDTPCAKGGTTDTGGSAWRFFSHEVIPVLKSVIPSEFLDDVLKIHRNLSIILRVISSKRKVETELLKQINTETYVFLRTQFEWVQVSESVHLLLAHSHQLIELNEGFGLGQMTEQGSEGVNKLVRRFSECFARQTSLDENITDVFNRLQILSNPFLMTFQRKQFCNNCKTFGEHWTVSCPRKEKKSHCNTLREELEQELNQEVESFLY